MLSDHYQVPLSLMSTVRQNERVNVSDKDGWDVTILAENRMVVQFCLYKMFWLNKHISHSIILGYESVMALYYCSSNIFTLPYVSPDVKGSKG